jgi:transposase
VARQSGIKLLSKQRQTLRQFMSNTKDKREYRAASGILLRAEGKKAKDVASFLGVTIKQVFAWTRFFRAKGIAGLHMKKPTGRKPIKAQIAKKIIPSLLRKDPQAFGYLKGRWVLRDIAKELRNEGLQIDFSSVHRILRDIGIVLKSPKMRAQGSMHKNYRKRTQIRNYKRAASMLLKKRSSWDFKMRNGLNFLENPRELGHEKDR